MADNACEDSGAGCIPTIEIAGRQCLVIPLSDLRRRSLDDLVGDGRFAGGDVVGSLTLDDRAFVVVACAGKRPAEDDLDAVATATADAPPPAATDLSKVLTQREMQIVELVAAGKSNKQAAYQLRISEYTVSSHVRRVFAKLHVRTRAAMVAYVTANGVLRKH